MRKLLAALAVALMCVAPAGAGDILGFTEEVSPGGGRKRDRAVHRNRPF
jgi:hypothetical protein